MNNNKSYILNEDIQHNIKLIAEAQAHKLAEDTIPDPLLPNNQRELQMQAEVERELTLFFEKFLTGLNELMITLMNLGKEEPELYSEKMVEQLDLMMQGLSSMGDNTAEVRPPREKCGLTTETMQSFNRAVSFLYDSKNYEKSSAVYFFLTFLDPNELAYWIGYGNSEFFLRRYQKALEAYHIASLVDPADPHCHFYSAHCHHELNDLKGAIDSCDKAINALNSSHEKIPHTNEWMNQAQQLKVFFEGIFNK
jgi:tetratricopeptide (TPR) repeat protein